ncbi:NADH-quinone oxidoreductase subunit H [bacterium]|nr:NADH-quinone oxidoreductase subunit H [bacterium]
MRILWFILSPLMALVVGLFFLGVSRRITARIHWRYGPPLYQPLIDILRQFTQKSVSHGRLFDLGIVLSLAGSVVLILFLPIGGICPMSSSGGLLVILYVMLLMPLGMALSGGEAANPNTSIGISRKLILAMGYELPLLLILLALMTRYETISIVEIVSAQRQMGSAFASFPLVLSGIAYLLIMPAILGVRPFEVVQAAQEISSGPIAEYGGPYLALATIQHALSLFIGISLFVNLLWGGAANPAVLFLKMLVVFVLVLFVNAAFPRLRVEQAVRYLWRWPALIALVGLILAATIGR